MDITENPINPFQVHTICRSDFDFSENPNSIYTVGEDLLKKVNYDTQIVDSPYELHEIAYAIASFPSNRSKLVLGSNESGRVEIVTDFNMDGAFPIMSFVGPVYRLVISPDEAYIAGSSTECSIQVYKVEQNKAYKPKPANESSCLHIGFSSNVKYVASSGCEGVINIYSIEKMEANPLDCKIRSQKIAKETRLDSSQLLRFDWHPKETFVALPGDLSLQVLRENENGNWDFSIESEIRHNKEISAVCWNADGSRILTFCIEHAFKLWDYATKTVLQSFNYDQPIYSCKFDPKANVFGFVCHKGYFGVWKESPKENNMIISSEMKEELHRELDIDEDEEEQDTIDRLLKEKEQESLEEERQRSKDNILDVLDDNKNKNSVQDSLLRELNEEGGDDEDRNARKKVVTGMHKKPASRHADIINTAAQPVLYSSSTASSRGRRYLCWNLMGCILASQEGQFNAIDIDFANKAFHTNIRILDTYGISMGCMNEKGIVLASKAEESQIDEYEDDLKDDSRRFSHVIFRPLNLQLEREKEWAMPLPEGENVDTIAIGNSWIAAFTDVHFIRFFNFKGLETKILCLEKPIVCSAGYENYLAFVYHDSPPFFGCQSMKVRVIDVDTLSTVFEGACPISPNATMTWFGFSDNGLIITQDSRGLIRGLFGLKQWLPLYVAEDSRRSPNLWLIGIHEYNFIGVALERGETEPAVHPKPSVRTVKIRMPYIREDEEETTKQSEIIKKQAILEHEKARNQAWIYNKITREKSDNLYAYSENILDRTGLLQMDESIEKNIVDLFQDYVVNDEHEKALLLAYTLKNVKSINICLFLCTQLKATSLSEKISDLLEARKRLAQVEENQQANAGTANQIVIIKGNESNPILENRNKMKKGLSSFAVQLQHKKESLPETQQRETMHMVEEDAGSRRPDPLHDFFNLLATKENIEEIPSQKSAQKKATTSQQSGSFAAFGREFVKKPTYDTEAAAKYSSLFETFSGKGSSNPLKRKPDQPLYKDDFKKMK